ncbi:MAG TPA: hypothetical protein VLX28_09650 [Thermoanaerobaculia bacterium]|nr:hypothetical protein [Thermoanaerobaculia bacterium]
MRTPSTVRVRKMLIVAQDPAVHDAKGNLLVTEVKIPEEGLSPGPSGYRVHVIDYDASTRTLYKPAELDRIVRGVRKPLFSTAGEVDIEDRRFHAQNVYAIVMRTLYRFESAFGRRVGWGFRGAAHVLKVAPHAFADSNAFYSEADEALLFGYFQGRAGLIYSCLSHDVIAHEATHALLGGLRGRFSNPSSPDQAAFHEGFADTVALLSMFSLRDMVKAVLDRSFAGLAPEEGDSNLIHERYLTSESLSQSLLLGLAKQMGQEMSRIRGQALRQSAMLKPSPRYLMEEEFQEPHRRGEIFVAAVINAFLHVLTKRLGSLGKFQGEFLNRDRAAEEAADAADYLLTVVIRALDYTPPVHLEFGDYLSALLTADHEIRPDDSKYQYRRALLDSFRSYGIKPTSRSSDGLWLPPSFDTRNDRVHFDSMTRDPEEVFRFIWENRHALGLLDGIYTQVVSVRPCQRVDPEDGFFLRETVVECIQVLELEAWELHKLRIRKPSAMPADMVLNLQGGLTLIFDEYGKLKFSVSNQLYDEARPEVQRRQSRRLKHLWESGFFRQGTSFARRFASLHRRRAMGGTQPSAEGW